MPSPPAYRCKQLAFTAGAPLARRNAVSQCAVSARPALCMSAKRPSGARPPPASQDGVLSEFAERWNGRFAMLGLVALVAPEVLNPAHPTIGAQLYAAVTFLPNLFLR